MAEDEDHQVKLIVEDTGVGIPQKTLQNIFSEKVKSTFGTDNEKGIGIGLKICREIVETHQGQIHTESTVQVGTKFIVILPKG